ncbi:MAG: DUF1926 domain-containing protein, partial [Chloroflexi bacterium]|nr:DUF1926 domain-containing protein [Chloroflexota bacterium]
RGLVGRHQIEILGGGFYEPVLASLPERDRIGQARRMADELEALFGRRPRGAWLAERVWEPDLPTSLVAAGYGWTILDDAHFRAAAIPEEDLWGPYTTEDQGRVMRVFGTEQGLRYRIPFRDPHEVIDYLRAHATEDGDRVGTMGDDGEKFGAWPTTWEHCWGEGQWVERFFEALETNADWLSTTTPSAWLAAHAPIGRVYVPTGSYAEMGAWALPPDEGRAFELVLHAAQDEGLPEARWLRGASWRNFQVRYREINDLHKQMLRVSTLVDVMADGPARSAALDHLYRGQSNDCYWHGLFGGIYIGHMRLATYEELIAAEDLAETEAGRLHTAEQADLDLDGIDEVRLGGPGQVVTVDLAEGAGIGSWDIRAVRHALGAVLRRRPEAYHETLRELDATLLAGAPGVGEPGSGPTLPETDPDGDAPTSIHTVVRTKEPGLAARLHYDPFERRSGLVRFLVPTTTPAAWAAGDAAELGDAIDGAFEIETLELDRLVVTRRASVRAADAAEPTTAAAATAATAETVDVRKEVVLGGDRRSPILALTVMVTNRSTRPVAARLGIEWTTMLLGGGANPAAWWEASAERRAHDSPGEAAAITTLAQGNDQVGVSIATTVSEPADAWWAPVETISNSEAGFERAYQGAGLLLSWPLDLGPGASRTFTVSHAVSTALDRAVDEPHRPGGIGEPGEPTS